MPYIVSCTVSIFQSVNPPSLALLVPELLAALLHISTSAHQHRKARLCADARPLAGTEGATIQEGRAGTRDPRLDVVVSSRLADDWCQSVAAQTCSGITVLLGRRPLPRRPVTCAGRATLQSPPRCVRQACRLPLRPPPSASGDVPERGLQRPAVAR